MPKKLPPIPEKSQLKLRKTLSSSCLLKNVRNEFEKIPEHRRGKVNYKLPDVINVWFSHVWIKVSIIITI